MSMDATVTGSDAFILLRAKAKGDFARDLAISLLEATPASLNLGRQYGKSATKPLTQTQRARLAVLVLERARNAS